MRTYVRMVVCVYLPRLELVIAAGGPEALAGRALALAPPPGSEARGGEVRVGTCAGGGRQGRPALAGAGADGVAGLAGGDGGGAGAARAPRRANAGRAGKALARSARGPLREGGGAGPCAGLRR